MLLHAVFFLLLIVNLFAEDAFRKSKPQIAVRLLSLSGLITVVEMVRFAGEQNIIFAALYAVLFVYLVSRFLGGKL